MHHRKGSFVKGHYRNGIWINPHNRRSSMVADYEKSHKNHKPLFGKKYIFPDKIKYSDLSEEECLELSYFQLKRLIKDGWFSDILINVAFKKEEELFSNMEYEDLIKLKKRGTYHCIDYELLLKHINQKRVEDK